MRIVLGMLKGAVLGGGVGYLAAHFGLSGFGFIVCGLAAALAGLLCGKPPWRHETAVTPILKMVFGFAVGAGLYYGWSYLDLTSHVASMVPKSAPQEIGFAIAPAAIAILYGTFVEIDDGGSKKPPEKS